MKLQSPSHADDCTRDRRSKAHAMRIVTPFWKDNDSKLMCQCSLWHAQAGCEDNMIISMSFYCVLARRGRRFANHVSRRRHRHTSQPGQATPGTRYQPDQKSAEHAVQYEADRITPAGAPPLDDSFQLAMACHSHMNLTQRKQSLVAASDLHPDTLHAASQPSVCCPAVLCRHCARAPGRARGQLQAPSSITAVAGVD